MSPGYSSIFKRILLLNLRTNNDLIPTTVLLSTVLKLLNNLPTKSLISAQETKRETNVLIVQQQFNKVQVLYSDNLVVFSLKQPLVAHTGKCLVTQMVQKLGTLAYDKESPNNETSRRLSKVRLKQRLYNRAKKSGRQSHWNEFKLVRKQLHKNLNRSRNDYLSDFLGDSIKQNPKAFWSHIKKLGKEDTDNQDLKVGNEVFTEPRVKAEVLNSKFSSVFNKEETENIQHLGENPIPTIGTINITTSGVKKQLRGLKADKVYGPDGIPP